MPLLGEITHHDEDLALERAVQLDWFTDDPARNEKLTRSYIWTKEAPKNFVSSAQLLNQTMEAFLSSNGLNELVIRATYGQGKTHLAVALANYFGKAADSVEVANILKKYEYCTEQSPERFANFKAGRQPFLVLRLRGDRRINLAQAVVSGLEAALRQNPDTPTITLGLWFEEARRILGTFSPDEKQQANDFLAPHSLDLDQLDKLLAKRDDTHYDLLHDLLKAVRHMMPNFGRTADPGEAIELVCDTYCGLGKSYAGLLVLFDEFSLFVNSYAASYRNQHGAPLQRLLDGIYNRKGKAVLLAFAQQSPHAHTLLKDKIQSGGGSPDDVGALVREMTRLDPKDELSLYAPMEDVLDAYLKQIDKKWDALMSDDELFDQATAAGDEVQRLFPERYNHSAQWDEERIQNVLVKGCFPLHPVATAIMCSVKLPATDNARSVLSFVVEAVQATAQEPAVRSDGQLNFIPATSLVQGLGALLAEDPTRWRQFSDALHLMGGEAPDNWREVLQALFLHEVLELKVRPGEFAQNIAALSSRPAAECAEVLDALKTRRYVRYDEGRQAYTFWPTGQSGTQVYEQLEKEANAIFSNPDKLREELKAAVDHGYDRWFEMPILHPYDWRASIEVLPVSLWSLDALRTIVQVSGWQISTNTLHLPMRGFAIYPIAADEYELQWIRDNAERTLNELVQELGDHLPPAVIMIPQQPQPNLIRKLVEQRVLHSWKKDKQEQLGAQSYVEARAGFDAEVGKLWETVEEQPLSHTIVPRPYRAAVEASGRTNSDYDTLLSCYRVAYRYVPPFFHQYKEGTNKNLSKAVRMGCGYLAEGSFDGWEKASQAFPVAQELFNRFLSLGSDSNWGYVDGAKRVQAPQKAPVLAAYKLLDKAVQRGSEKIPMRPLLEQLLNPPYGLDLNILSLVYCGWYGTHHQHLTTRAADGQVLQFSDWLADAADPRKIIDTLFRRDVHLSRRDETQLVGRVSEVAKLVKDKTRFSLSEAQGLVLELNQYETDPMLDERTRASATSTLKLLNGDIKVAAEFEAAVQKITQQLAEPFAPTMTVLKQTLEYKRTVPTAAQLGSVHPIAEAELPALSEQIRSRLRDITQKVCDDATRLSSVEQYGLQLNKLDAIRSDLERAKEYDLVDVAEQAKNTLAQARTRIISKGADAPFLSRFENLKSVQTLEQMRELATAAATYEPAHEDSRTRLDKYLETLQTSIRKAEQDLTGWQNKLATVLKSKDLIDLKTALNTNQFRYQGEPEEAALNDLYVQRETVKKLFSKLADLKEAPLRNHNDLQKLLTAYDKLAALPGLSPAQQALATTARDAASAKLQQQIDDSVTELYRLTARSQEPDYDEVKLMGELNRDQPFLPKEYQAQLTGLRKTVRAKIDENVARQVEDLVFNQISDPAKRQECLARLQDRFNRGDADSNAGD